MALQIRLRNSQKADLSVVRDLGADRVSAIIARVAQLTIGAMDRKLVRQIAIEELGQAEDKADGLIRSLFSLSTLCRQGGHSVGDVLDALRQAIRQDSGWSEGELAKWTEIEPKFAELMESRFVRH